MSEAALPYAGTSGHSGTDASRDRAIEADTSGTTNERQRQVLAWLAGEDNTWLPECGLTVKDVREATRWHHGVASSVLTTLHIAGRIARLTEKRDRCHVYVLPEYVNGRTLSPYTQNKRNRPAMSEAEIEAIEEAAFARGMQAATEEPSFPWGQEEAREASVCMEKIDKYLRGKEEFGTNVAWVSDLRRIVKRVQRDG